MDKQQPDATCKGNPNSEGHGIEVTQVPTAGGQAVPSADPSSWGLSQEREFIESLLCQRFNFLLVFYSLVIMAAFTTRSQTNFSLALTLGALICSLFTLPIARAQHKLDLILKHIEQEQPEHPVRRTDDWAREPTSVPKPVRFLVHKSRRHMIGYWIPVLCSASLWVGAVLSWLCVLRAK
jgi:hypothetical protein